MHHSGFAFSERSRRNLDGLHPDLVRVAHRALAITEVDFVVIEGRRSRARQAELVADGKSRTMNSRHLTGHALDVMALDPATGRGSWEVPLYHRIAVAFKQAAAELDVPIVWGGDWAGFFDGPHIELERHAYPADGDIHVPRPVLQTGTGRSAALGIGGAVAGAAGSAVGVVAENADALIDTATSPAVRGALDILPAASAIAACLVVVALAAILVAKRRRERAA